MNILLINTFHYRRGGDCAYTLDLARLLERSGEHKVLHFAMHHEKNYPSQFARYFVPEIDFAESLNRLGFNTGWRVFTRAIYSTVAKRKINDLLREQKVDVAHVQNIRGHITPSIFGVLRKFGIPIVWTLHDFFVICPNSTFFAGGKICEACKNNKFYRAVLAGCRKGSRAASLVVALEEYAYRLMGWLKCVDLFIAPSEFMKAKMLAHGFPCDKVTVLPNFVESLPQKKSGGGDFVLFAGRLVPGKGVTTLLQAWPGNGKVGLKIAGDGPLREDLKKIAAASGLRNVEFLGHVSKERLEELLDGARFSVVPSEWYENAPYAVLEAFAHGKAVVGARIGGIPELIRDGQTGLLFNAGDAGDLRGKISWALNNRRPMEVMGSNARSMVNERFSADRHYYRLMKIYRQLRCKNK